MGVTKLQELKKKAEENPDDMDKWFELGKYAADRFIVGISELALTKVVKNRPGDANVLELLAKALNRKRKLAESEKVYKRALEIEPENTDLLTGLAVVYGNQGELETSVEWYKKALSVDPGFSWAVHSYRHTLETLGKIDDIGPMLKRAYEVNPDNALVTINYSEFLKGQGQTAEYQKHLEKGLALLEDATAEEQNRSLRILMGLHKPSAVKYADLLHKKDPDHVDILLVVCTLKGETEPQNVKDMLLKALQEDPTSIRIMGTLIVFYLQTKDIAGVMEIKARMDAEQPEDALMDVVDMTLMQGDVKGLLSSEEKRAKFIETTAKLAKRFPGRLFAITKYINALLQDSRYDEARMQYRHAIDNIPLTNLHEILALGLVLQHHRMYQEAKETFAIASSKAETRMDELMIKLAEYEETEKYTDMAEELQSFVEDEQADPQIYAILGRVQSYIKHPDAKQNLQIAADANQFDSMILLAALLKRENDAVRSTKYLKQVLNSPEASSLDKVRSLMGLGNEEEAIKKLDRLVDEEPSAAGWFILIQARKKDGSQAVETVVKRMLQVDTSLGNTEPTTPMEDITIDSMAKQFTSEVMAGIIAGKIKHLLVSRLIREFVSENFSEEED